MYGLLCGWRQCYRVCLPWGAFTPLPLCVPSLSLLMPPPSPLSSQVRGVLWRQYRDSKAIFDVISKVFGKVDGGYFNMTEVSLDLVLSRFGEVNRRADSLTYPTCRPP